MESFQAEEMLRGQAQIWRHIFAYIDSMVLKCAVGLRIADIIHSKGGYLTLSQIASHIDTTSSPNIDYLNRVMRLLVRKKIFTEHQESEEGETLYGLTSASKWFLHGSKQCLVPMVKLHEHECFMSPWHYLDKCVKNGGEAFNMAHGCDVWDFASKNSEFNTLFNEAMACTSRTILKTIINCYKEGFESLESWVDVGGGTGGAIAEIVRAYPHTKGINFDLPHVTTTAPTNDDVKITHVAGDMLEAIPNADALFMKWIMHIWSDEDCVRILKNCRKAITKNNGRTIIVEAVLKPHGDDMFDETRAVFDLLMVTYTSSGRERTELEWKKILEDGGFPRYNIIEIPALVSIIEAFPEKNLEFH